MASQVGIVAPGSSGKLAPILDAAGAKSVFLVTGSTSFGTSGVSRILDDALRARRVVPFPTYAKLPCLSEVGPGSERCREEGCEVIIAVGGGRVIDTAKLISLFAPQRASPVAIVGGTAEIECDAKPLIALPTTAGSGSEATHFAVLFVGETKLSISHESMRPRHALVDANLTRSAPPAVKASSGLDVICQSIESLWSVNSTPQTREWAQLALRLALAHLEQSVHSPTPVSLEAMSRAAYLAGRSIDVTKTTAPHALSYSLTARFGVPHGHAVALLLGETLVYNGQVDPDSCADPRGSGHVHGVIQEIVALLNGSDVASCREEINRLIRALGLATRLRDVGVRTVQDREYIADHVNVDRLANNPRRMTRDEILSMVERLS
ncbi:MAG: phosphonoacetaldehyde reductase [Isosphaeraceae bacterium]|nr:phosphonoacetaldehyde reductase [Isosphaeraceae bacterium]